MAAGMATMPKAASAAQRGAEDPYATQIFEDSVCSQRTLLGACKEVAARDRKAERASAARVTTLQAPTEPESELVKRLLERSAANADANARLVKEKTVAAGLSGTYGPFAKAVPIMRADGNFEEISFARYDKLKDKGKIVKTPTGLDACAEATLEATARSAPLCCYSRAPFRLSTRHIDVQGFDPDAPEPPREKFLGLF